MLGADGASSIVRKHLENTDNFECEEKYLPNKYKTLFLSPVTKNLRIELDRDKLHSFRMDNGMAIMVVPQPENKLSCVVGFDLETNPVIPSFCSKEKFSEFITNNFPKLAKLITLEEAEAFLTRSLSDIVTISSNRYHQNDNVVIIGDAAHAMSPSLGQGCNSALEDVVILDRLLDENNDDWAKVLPQFTSLRIPDIQALQEMSNNAFPKSKLLLLEFIWRRKATQIIKKIFPNYQSKFMFDLLETTIPYSEILKLSQNWVNKVKKSNRKILKTR